MTANEIWHSMLFSTEKAMAPHSSTLAWKIPWTEEPGRLQSMGSLRVGHDWATSLSLFTFMHWRRKWQLTPVFLPRESQGRGSLMGCHLWGRTESDTTERLNWIELNTYPTQTLLENRRGRLTSKLILWGHPQPNMKTWQRCHKNRKLPANIIDAKILNKILAIRIQQHI